MITIKNTQKTVPLNIDQIKEDAQTLLTELGYADFDLGILVTTNATIRQYNKEYRHIDKPTDILSFPYHPDLQPGERIIPITPEDKNIGDLIISAEYVQVTCKEYNVPIEKRFKTLLVHGICHLLGYKHEFTKDKDDMEAMEQNLLKTIT